MCCLSSGSSLRSCQPSSPTPSLLLISLMPHSAASAGRQDRKRRQHACDDQRQRVAGEEARSHTPGQDLGVI
jgi:hypothetical protein